MPRCWLQVRVLMHSYVIRELRLQMAVRNANHFGNLRTRVASVFARTLYCLTNRRKVKINNISFHRNTPYFVIVSIVVK